MSTLSVVRNGQTITFAPGFASTAEAVAFIKQQRAHERSKFLSSLVAQHATNKGLSSKQQAWLLFMATQEKGKQETPAPPQPAASPATPPIVTPVIVADEEDDCLPVEGLVRVLENAREHGLKRPTLALHTPCGELAVKPGRNCWWLFLREEVRGRISPEGHATLWRLSDEEMAAVEAALLFATIQPLKALQQFGRVTGRCSCCRRKLSDAKSVELGIGPICKTKFGL